MKSTARKAKAVVGAAKRAKKVAAEAPVAKSSSASRARGRASLVKSFLQTHQSKFARLLTTHGRLVLDMGPKGPTFSVAKKGGERRAKQRSLIELDHALAAARRRGITRVAEILRSSEMLSAEEFAQLLGTTRVTVNTKRQNHQVLGLEGPTRGYRFPSWQLNEDGRPFAALPELFERLGGSPWAVYRFLVQHHAELDGLTGLEALRSGLHDEVIDAAESVSQAFG